MWRSWLRHGMVIARSEWILYQREYRGIAGRRLLWGAVIVISVVLGWGMYELGRDVATGGTAPFSVLGITAISAMAWVAWRSSRLSRNSFEELEPDFLLATVPASVPALGLLLFVYARIAIIVVAPTVAIAIGAAVGFRAPTVALTVVLAVATSTAVAVGAGVSARLAAHLIGMRLARGRTYRDLLILFGWLPLLVGWFLLGELSNLALTRLDILPAIAVVDFALLGALGQQESILLADWLRSSSLSPRRRCLPGQRPSSSDESGKANPQPGPRQVAHIHSSRRDGSSS